MNLKCIIVTLVCLTYLVPQPTSSIALVRRKGGKEIVYGDAFPVMAFQQSTPSGFFKPVA